MQSGISRAMYWQTVVWLYVNLGFFQTIFFMPNLFLIFYLTALKKSSFLSLVTISCTNIYTPWLSNIGIWCNTVFFNYYQKLKKSYYIENTKITRLYNSVARIEQFWHHYEFTKWKFSPSANSKLKWGVTLLLKNGK